MSHLNIAGNQTEVGGGLGVVFLLSICIVSFVFKKGKERKKKEKKGS